MMPLTFTPSTLEYSTKAVEVLNFDMSALVSSLGGTSAVTPTVDLYDLDGGDDVDLGASPNVVNGTTIQLELDGSILAVNHRYRLEVGCTASPSANKATMLLAITAEF